MAPDMHPSAPRPPPGCSSPAGTPSASIKDLPAQRPTAPAPTTRRLHSQDLLGQAQEVEILHAGSVYRLRQTTLGKLILTK